MKKKLKNSIATIVFFFTIAGFSQNQNGNILSIKSFYEKIKSQDKPQIIDARTPEEFALNHIEGAINFNLDSENYLNFANALDKLKPVFIYSIRAGRSVALEKELLKNGFKETYSLEGGIGAWIGSGKPFYSNTKSKLLVTEYKKIITDNQTVLVDIGSQYCCACKKVKPILETIKTQYGTNLKIVEIDLEDNPQVIADLKTVQAFPTILLYRNGKIILKKEGIIDLKKEVDLALTP